ncbi:hypothetical protein EVAR_32614_1 [Eumeta japonica]|uniref:Uncharacterized protein n=1 Tax=Eumeta variegata TaxID=151549 RepID=A0A4C1WJ56_EUMVA|nr:hypothetical protein EVAR_32614_1 [Eumeta japonica]
MREKYAESEKESETRAEEWHKESEPPERVVNEAGALQTFAYVKSVLKFTSSDRKPFAMKYGGGAARRLRQIYGDQFESGRRVARAAGRPPDRRRFAGSRPEIRYHFKTMLK